MTASPQLIARLERKGWTLQQALQNPEERWPVPSPPYPAGRYYHFLNDRDIALIVDDTGVIASVPGHEAWEAIEQYNPQRIDHPHNKVVMKHQGHGGRVLDSVNMSAPWMVQTIATFEGTWTVHATQGGGGAVLLGEEVVAEYDLAEEINDREDIPEAVVEAAWLIQRKGR